MKKAYIFNTGCIRRALDCTKIYRYFIDNGWAFTNQISAADLIVIGTCGTIRKNEKLSVIAIEGITKKASKNAVIIITGCLPKINPNAIPDSGDYIFVPTRELEKFDNIINSKKKFHNLPDANMVTNDAQILDYVLAYRYFRNSYSIGIYSRLSTNGTFLKLCLAMGDALNFVKSKLGFTERQRIVPYFNLRIAEGCTGTCSYCAIRFSTGRLKSKPEETILEEFNKGLEEGHKYFQLISEDTGCYGLDIGTNIVSLLRKLFAVEGEFKLVLIDFCPQWLIKYFDELMPLFFENRDKIRELFVSLQSGSDKVLRAMKRPYKIEQVKSNLKALKEQVPELILRTTVIIGFPGETEEDFKMTVNAVREIDFTEVQLNKYEDRPGTASSKMNEKISQFVIDQRYKEIKKVCQKKLS